MQLALTVDSSRDRDLLFAQQLGVNHIFAHVDRWDRETLAGIRNRVEQCGLELAGVENLPRALCERAMVGLGGGDEAIEQVCNAIKIAGAAGIPLVTYRLTAPGIRRTDGHNLSERDATGRRYDHAEAEQAPRLAEHQLSSQVLWRNVTAFMDRVIPVAEAAGVQMACHPDDPPVPSQGGSARILHNVEGLTKLLDAIDSPYHGLDLCLGSLATMPDVDAIDAIHQLGRTGRILTVHVRNCRGTTPSFGDAFLDDGDLDIVRALAGLGEVGFSGSIRAAQPPAWTDDTEWGHKARAFDLGFLRAIIQQGDRLRPLFTT